MDVTVQPAVSWMGLNDEIEKSGLFFPVDPAPSVSWLISYLAGGEGNTMCSRRRSVVWWVQAAGRCTAELVWLSQPSDCHVAERMLCAMGP